MRLAYFALRAAEPTGPHLEERASSLEDGLAISPDDILETRPSALLK